MDCSVEGCPAESRALGMCAKHYKRFKKHGDPLVVLSGRVRTNPLVCVVDGCGEPTTTKTAKGFCVRHYKQHSSAHRLVERRKYLDTYKVSHGCVDCGFNEHPAALEFDHLPGYEKLFDIGRAVYKRAWKAVLAEIEKCEVVCSNCHRIRTAERRGESLYSQISRGEVVL